MIAKVLRKLGLGHVAYVLAAPIYRARYRDLPQLPPEQALEFLWSQSPDRGASAVIEERDWPGAPEVELDIIVPAYNVEDSIEACIASIRSQRTSHSFRIVVVNDGSTDGTLEKLRSMDGITVIDQANQGLSGARNTGLAHARGEYVLFLDSDDYLCPGAIEALMGPAMEKGAWIVEGGYKEIDEQGRQIRSHSHKAGPLEPARDCLGYAWGKVIKREAFRRLIYPISYWYQDSMTKQLLLPMARDKLVWGVDQCVVAYTQNRRGITQKSRVSAKSLDSLYVTLRLFQDRQTLGLETDQGYYDYILNMAVLTFSRTKNQEDKVKQAIFWVYADLLDRHFSSWHTQDQRLRPLEKALRDRDYGSYLLYCMLH